MLVITPQRVNNDLLFLEITGERVTPRGEDIATHHSHQSTVPRFSNES